MSVQALAYLANEVVSRYGTDCVGVSASCRETALVQSGKAAVAATGEQPSLCSSIDLESESVAKAPSSERSLNSGLDHSKTNNPPATLSGMSSLRLAVDFAAAVDNLPNVGASEAPIAAATRLVSFTTGQLGHLACIFVVYHDIKFRLRLSIANLDRGEMLSAAALKGCLDYAATILENVSKAEPGMRFIVVDRGSKTVACPRDLLSIGTMTTERNCLTSQVKTCQIKFEIGCHPLSPDDLRLYRRKRADQQLHYEERCMP